MNRLGQALRLNNFIQKKSTATTPQQQGLKRVLKLYDLIAYGVGSTVGAGIYTVVAVASALSGPSITLSFLFCCLACACTGLVYAEFAVRIPQAGSAYTFTYTTFGEFLAWTVGWALTLEYCISGAATARSFGSYIDALVSAFGGKDPSWVNQIATGEGSIIVLSPTSAILVLLLSGLLLLGVKNSSLFNVICTGINLVILLFFIIAGSIFVAPWLWTAPVSNVTVFLNSTQVMCNVNGSTFLPEVFPIPSPGGFLPFGFSGVMQAAGILFFSFLGFDSVSTLAEEAANPPRDLPIAIISSLVISGGLYCAISLVLNGMLPWNYYLTSCDFGATWIPNGAPLSFAFQQKGLIWASQLMAFGALLATTVSTFTSLVGQPRIFYRMSQDGLFFQVFGKLNPKTGVPTLGVIIIGVFASIVAFAVPIDELSDFISLGSLYAFTTVDAGILFFRYSKEDESRGSPPWVVLVLIFVFCQLCIVSCVCITQQDVISVSSPLTIIAIIAGAGAVAVFVVFALLPQKDTSDLIFRCPLVPLIPCIGILVNIFMMVSRSALTYYAFLVWFAVGVLIYVFYGVVNSKLRKSGETVSLLVNQ